MRTLRKILGRSEQDASYYDNIFLHSDEYAKGPQNTLWSPIWEEVAARIDKIPSKTIPVLDIGCGPGHLGKLLGERDYIGIDFSAVAIKQAKARVPWGTFVCKPIELDWVQKHAPGRVVTLCEILEHVYHDKEILQTIPSGTHVVFSVPTFFCLGHVRRFKRAQHVRKRYQKLFSEFDVVPIGKKHFVASGIRA